MHCIDMKRWKVVRDESEAMNEFQGVPSWWPTFGQGVGIFLHSVQGDGSTIATGEVILTEMRYLR